MILDLKPIPQSYIIPSTALYGRDRVYIIKDERMHAIKVENLGNFTNPNGSYNVIIKSIEIKDGDKIITSQLPNARTGLKTRIVE